MLAGPGLITRIAKKISKWGGLAFGWGLTRNIEEAYAFLMNTGAPPTEYSSSASVEEPTRCGCSRACCARWACWSPARLNYFPTRFGSSTRFAVAPPAPKRAGQEVL